jgi:chemotaxis protein MotB
MVPSQQPIIIIKKKSGHGGHHGGAWKVAYADFVTAMMALFIVLWLMNTSKPIKENISGYFKDPKGFAKKVGASKASGGMTASETTSKDDMKLLKEKLEEALKKRPELANLKDFVKITVTPEGLRIELLENDKGMFFASGKPIPTELGKAVLEELARQLGKLPNPLLIEGHTDSKPYDGAEYSNWELSADRANAARRIMEVCALHPHQVAQVRGFADNQLRLPDKPTDSSNRRVSILVQYLELAGAQNIKLVQNIALHPTAKH